MKLYYSRYKNYPEIVEHTYYEAVTVRFGFCETENGYTIKALQRRGFVDVSDFEDAVRDEVFRAEMAHLREQEELKVIEAKEFEIVSLDEQVSKTKTEDDASATLPEEGKPFLQTEKPKRTSPAKKKRGRPRKSIKSKADK